MTAYDRSMDRPSSEGEVRECARPLPLPRDFARPGPCPMSLGDAMGKIEAEFGEAVALLGKL
jgi:hypothetical protein